MIPEPIFKLFGLFPVYMYGVCIAVGILACFLVFFGFTKYKKMHPAAQDFAFYVAIGAIALGFLSAKVFQAFYNFIEDGIFDFANAGVTAMGGFVGGAAAFIVLYFGVGHFLFKGERKGLHIKEFNKIILTAPICITIAHALGRIGCLMSGCCHGAYLGGEYVFGGIWMKGSGVWGYYVPTQLYESLFLFLLTGILAVLFFKRFNITHIVYLISYGAWRIIIEFFRTDDRGAVVLGLAPSQWQSIVFIVGGLALLAFYLVKRLPIRYKVGEDRIEYLPKLTEQVADL